MSLDRYCSEEHRTMLKSFLNKDRLTEAMLVLYDAEWTHEDDAERDILREARHILARRCGEYDD